MADVSQSEVSSSIATPPSSLWKILLYIFGFLLLLAILFWSFPYYASLFSHDIGTIEDSDLMPVALNIPEDENGYYELSHIDSVYVQSLEVGEKHLVDITKGKEWDQKLVDKMIAQNQEALTIFANLSHKTYIQNPATIDPAKYEPWKNSTTMRFWITTARMQAVKALSISKEGKSQEALEEAIIIAEIGYKLQQGQSIMMDYLVGTTIKGLGLSTMRTIVSTSTISNELLATYNKKLDKFYNNEDGFVSNLQYEYVSQAWLLDQLAKGEISVLEEFFVSDWQNNDQYKRLLTNRYYYQPNRTKSMLAEYIRGNIQNVKAPCNSIRPVVIERKIVDPSTFELYFRPNVGGLIMHDLLAVDIGNTSKKCDDDIEVGATQLGIALNIFEADKGNYPRSLQELVPNYLTELPEDVYQPGTPLKYNFSKGVIYSIGEDLFDNKGDKEKDLVFPLANS